MKEIEKSSVKNRLVEFLRYKNFGQRYFEEICGLSNGYVNNIRKSIKSETFDEKIFPKFPELNKFWLLHGEGSMLKDSSVSVKGINNVVGDNNINVGNSNVVTKDSDVKVGGNSDISSLVEQQKELLKRLEVSQEQLTESQKHLSESQKQVSNLIEIISNKLK